MTRSSLLVGVLLIGSTASLLPTARGPARGHSSAYYRLGAGLCRALPCRCSAAADGSAAGDDLAPGSRSFEATLAALHTSAVAAADQQQRLRKGDAGTLAEPSECDGAARATVYLVGVGPGDVELLTVKALRLMQEADLVLYDRLISPEILELVGDAAMLYVGKEAGLHTRPQEEIHQLLLRFATSGRTVVRLKGGDPTVFGRGGEEMEYLEQQGVEVRIVPGVTAAAGIAASLGVPLTHRDYADSVRFITGHARSENSAPVEDRYPWAQLADPKTTLVIYMGLSTLPSLAEGLVAAGLPADTPAIAVQDGTTPTQRVVAASLAELPGAVVTAELRSPTLMLIGQVVSLYDPIQAAAAIADQSCSTLTASAEEVLQWASRRPIEARDAGGFSP